MTVMFLFTGCTIGVAAQQKTRSDNEYAVDNSELSWIQKRKVKSGRVWIGMSERLMKTSLYFARDYVRNINVTIDKYGTSKQYVIYSYKRGVGEYYIYTDNGFVTTIQK